MIAALSGVTAQAAEHKVTVCMESPEVGLTESSASARALASTMFARIGVTVKWRLGLRGCPPKSILIAWDDGTPPTLYPGALAWAQPYEGTQIRVFHDRITRNHGPAHVPIVMAHVLVHEITHLLQGISRHSRQGVMKSKWEQTDFTQMVWEPLTFTEEDVALIHQGLAGRAAGALAEWP